MNRLPACKVAQRSMYFRDKTTPSGQVLQLVEAFRDSQGQPRQRIVISLGDTLISPEDRPLVAKAVERQLCGQTELIEIPAKESVLSLTHKIVQRVRAQNKRKPLASAPERQLQAVASEQATPAVDSRLSVDGVLIDDIDHDSKGDLGAVLVGLDAWRKLGMDLCLEELGFNPAQRLGACLNVINRLVDPVCENALSQWVSTTSLAELLGAQALECDRDRFYRVSDLLLKKRKQIGAHLRKRQQELFGLERTLLLYDLTNTYFEGTASANPKARRGKSKHKRDDCPQLVVGMVFDEYGFELTHEVFEGNTHDSKTLVHMIEQLQQSVNAEEQQQLPLKPAKPMVILDGGIATKANRRWLRKAGYSYLVNETRIGRKKWAKEFGEDGKFELVAGRDNKSAVHTRVIVHPEDDEDAKQITERIVLCKSDGRKQKEQAILTRAEARFVEDLESLSKRITSGKLKDQHKIQRCLGRLESKHSRIARFYSVRLEESPSLKLVWQTREQQRTQADELFGCYVLRCYEPSQELPDSALWGIYMMLTQAEDGFSCLKGDLGLRPVRHHLEGRCDAHIFITVLAYHLLRHIQYRLEQSQDCRSWETLRRLLSSHVYVTIVVPTTADGTYRIRKAGRPDEQVRALYLKLGVEWENLPISREHLPATTTTL